MKEPEKEIVQYANVNQNSKDNDYGHIQQHQQHIACGRKEKFWHMLLHFVSGQNPDDKIQTESVKQGRNYAKNYKNIY